MGSEMCIRDSTGTNDSPVISEGNDTTIIDEANTSITSSGSINVVDIDLSDTVDVSIQDIIISGGSFNAANVPAALTTSSNQALREMLSFTPAAGTEMAANPNSGSTFSWNFTSGNSDDSAFNFLAEGETLQLTYTIQTTDSSIERAGQESDNDTTTVVVTVTGTNDTPDITAVVDTAVVTEDTGSSPSGSTAAPVSYTHVTLPTKA